MTTILATTRTTLPAIDCAPWCEDGDGHTEEWHPEDQVCSSTTTEIPLTRAPMVRMNDGATVLDHMSLYLEQVNGRAPEVHLGQSDDVGVGLTPAEATDLGLALIRLAKVATDAASQAVPA